MKAVVHYLRDLSVASVSGWNRFWFTATDPATLGFIRILAGAMLFYTHLVWTRALEQFFGPYSWTSPAAARSFLGDNGFAWSYFWWIDSPTVLWLAHFAALVVFAMLTIGLFSRVTSVLAFICAVSYIHRVPGSWFGLDQINIFLAMYLMVGPSGAAYSVDRWLAKRRAGGAPLAIVPSVSANVAIRLLQIHMCIIYFYAGLSKMQGGSWWAGAALWGAFANLEYQTLDMTWLATWPVAIAFLTHSTAYWEMFFPALIWPRIIRPIWLAFAIPLHLGIGICMGMMTFGLAMLIGCASFLPPEFVRTIIDGRQSRGGQGGAAEEPRVSIRVGKSRQTNARPPRADLQAQRAP